MSEQEWAYYKNKKEQGTLLLHELLEGVDSGRFELSTLVKAPQGIYWSEIRANPEILNYLPCRYIIDNVIHSASSGKEMLSLYEEGLIHSDTNVRLEKSGEYSWLKLKKSFYWQMVSGDRPVFYGHSSLLPKGKPLVARMIDKLLCFLLGIPFVIYACCLFNQDYGHLSVWSSTLAALVFFSMAVLLYAGFQAAFLHLFGGTLGSRLMGFYILTSKLEKLSFFKAFKRQVPLTYAYFDKSSKDKAYYKQFGASFWDAKNGVIFSKESPEFFSMMNLEN